LTLSLKRSQPAPGEEDEFRRRFVSDPPTDKERDAADAAITRLRRHNYPPHESNTEVDEGTPPRDDPNIVDTAEAILAARAILSRVPPAERTIVVKALEENLTGGAAGGESAGTDDPATVEPRPDAAAKETTNRAKAAPRSWNEAKARGEALPEFVQRMFADECQAGTLSTATLYQDQELYGDYQNWRRRRNLPQELHWLRDLPTGKKQRTAAAKKDFKEPMRVADFEPAAQEAIRTYNRMNRRATRARGDARP
jgi:hypothetical protein